MSFTRPMAVIFFLVMASLAEAEKVNLPPAKLRRIATHVVIGDVKAIYRGEKREGDWQYTHFIAEIDVEKLEKGESLERSGFEKRGVIYVRYWRRAWKGPGVTVGTAGHRGLPSEGEKLRIYLARESYDGFTQDNRDGGFNVIGANGFEKLSVNSDPLKQQP